MPLALASCLRRAILSIRSSTRGMRKLSAFMALFTDRPSHTNRNPPGLPSRNGGLGTKNTGLECEIEGSISLNSKSLAIVFSISGRLSGILGRRPGS
eukprot:08534_6